MRLTSERNQAFMLRAFTVGLGLATVVHHEILGDPSFFSLKNLAAGVAVVAILRPSARTLLALLVAELISIGQAYPDVYNHSVVIGILALGIVAYAAWCWISGNRQALDEARLYATIAPPVRLTVLATYMFAAFAKLNQGFFDDRSCATKIYNDIVDTVPVLPRTGALDGPLMYGTVAVEFAIPVLLLFRRTRLAGLALGISFHLVLIAGGHSPFTSAAIAFYLGVFLPDDMRERLETLGRRRPRLQSAALDVRRFSSSGTALAGALLIWAAASVLNTNTGLDPMLDRATAVSLLLIGLLLTAVVIAALWPSDDEPRVPTGTLRPMHAAWLILPLGVVLIALSPYVGLKTTASFTMYSNLRTEGGYWNHLVMPEAVKVFDYQDDLVTIVRSDDPELVEVAEDGDQMVWFDLAEHRRARTGYEVTVLRDGETVKLGADSALEDLDAPPHALSKVMSFRVVSTSQACQH